MVSLVGASRNRCSRLKLRADYVTIARRRDACDRNQSKLDSKFGRRKSENQRVSRRLFQTGARDCLETPQVKGKQQIFNRTDISKTSSDKRSGNQTLNFGQKMRISRTGRCILYKNFRLLPYPRQLSQLPDLEAVTVTQRGRRILHMSAFL